MGRARVLSCYQEVLFMNQETIQALVNPGSIALIGVPRGLKAGKVFLLGLLDLGYSGDLYLVHPSAEAIDGIKTHRSLTDIPGEVEMVIVLSPKESIWEVLDACAAKKVTVVVLYTSGFSELGGGHDRRDEERMREIARSGGFRIIGPNCMGIYSPGASLAPFPMMPRVAGNIGFLTQSGSLMTLFINACALKQLHFHSSISYGNSCDIGLAELLEWMYTDEQVGVICSYTEGLEDPGALHDVFKRHAWRKPLVMWKVGSTDAGGRAAASHTGSLTGKAHLWDALFRQFGIISVSDIEEMLDTVMACSRFSRSGRGRVVIISGPGGPAVSASDAVERNGLEMATLSESSRKRLENILPPTGTSRGNPVDVGLGASFELGFYLDTLEVLIEDAGIDALVILGGGISDDMNRTYVDGLIRVKEKTTKDLIVVTYPGFMQRDEILAPLHAHGIPVYSTPERAMKAYARLLRFERFQEGRISAVSCSR